MGNTYRRTGTEQEGYPYHMVSQYRCSAESDFTADQEFAKYSKALSQLSFCQRPRIQNIYHNAVVLQSRKIIIPIALEYILPHFTKMNSGSSERTFSNAWYNASKVLQSQLFNSIASPSRKGRRAKMFSNLVMVNMKRFLELESNMMYLEYSVVMLCFYLYYLQEEMQAPKPKVFQRWFMLYASCQGCVLPFIRTFAGLLINADVKRSILGEKYMGQCNRAFHNRYERNAFSTEVLELFSRQDYLDTSLMQTKLGHINGLYAVVPNIVLFHVMWNQSYYISVVMEL